MLNPGLLSVARHLTGKERQHFAHVLVRAKDVGASLDDVLTILLADTGLEYSAAEATEMTEDEMPKRVGPSAKPCPKCGKKMLVANHKDLDGSWVPIAKCKKCQISRVEA